MPHCATLLSLEVALVEPFPHYLFFGSSLLLLFVTLRLRTPVPHGSLPTDLMLFPYSTASCFCSFHPYDFCLNSSLFPHLFHALLTQRAITLSFPPHESFRLLLLTTWGFGSRISWCSRFSSFQTAALPMGGPLFSSHHPPLLAPVFK